MIADRPEISEASLGHAVDFAAEAGTAQLVIIRGGDVLVDEAFTPEAVDVYAVQKGLTSVLFGIAEARGLLGLDDPVSDVLGSGWTHLPATSEAQLTIRAALDMTTGVDDALRPLGEVGVTWRYDNVTYNYLKTVLELVAGAALIELTREWLCDPLDMASTRWVDRAVLRPDGRPITGLESTARDLARLGSMVLEGGRGIAPADHLRRLGRPGSEANPSWGLCWWNNDQSHQRLPRRESEVRPGPAIPGAPPDTIAARGAMENRLFVVPSLALVVARTAVPVARGRRPIPFDGTFWGLLNPPA